jgi:hypothetical protein
MNQQRPHLASKPSFTQAFFCRLPGEKCVAANRPAKSAAATPRNRMEGAENGECPALFGRLE